MREIFSTRWLVLGCGPLLAMAFHTAVRGVAAEPAPSAAAQNPPQPALDDALLKDLDNELLEGAGALKPRPVPNFEKASGAREKRPQPPADGEDIGLSQPEDDPLLRISQEMRSAESLIPEHAKRQDAELLQRQVIEGLARLIEQAEQQSAQQQSASSEDRKPQKTHQRQTVQQPKTAGGSKDSNQPSQDSTARMGPSETARPDPELIKRFMKDSWGNLPPRAREQMLQNSPERFLPQYELMIERYYRRLAEDQKAK